MNKGQAAEKDKLGISEGPGIVYLDVLADAFHDTAKSAWGGVINSQNVHFDEIAAAAGAQGDKEAFNAIAHTTSSAYIEVVVGDAFGSTAGDAAVWILGTAKEMMSDKSQHLDSLKDELNNDVGRDIGRKIIESGGYIDDIKPAVREAFEDGRMWRLEKGGIGPTGGSNDAGASVDGTGHDNAVPEGAFEAGPEPYGTDPSGVVDYLLGTDAWGLEGEVGSSGFNDFSSGTDWSGQSDACDAHYSSDWGSSGSDSGYSDHVFDGGFGHDSPGISDFGSSGSASDYWRSDHHTNSSNTGQQSDFWSPSNNSSSNGRFD